MSEEHKSAVEIELTAGVREKLVNRQKFAEHTGEAFTAEIATAASMDEFRNHLHDPRTVERACSAYFARTDTEWEKLNPGTQEVWRKNVQAILNSVLEE